MFFEFSNNEYVSPVSIGGKVKRIREHLGLSQKQLGERCGFSESTDVRIRQYESNKKIPREKALKTLCSALEIDESALFDADLLPTNMMYHALFDIEDCHGLHPVLVNEHYYLDCSGPTIIGNNEVLATIFQSFLKNWYEKRNECLPNRHDSEEIKKEKRKEYDLWRYQYPTNEAIETSERLHMLRKKEHLEQELREINEKLNFEQNE